MKLWAIGIVLGLSTILLGGMVYAQCCNGGWGMNYYNTTAKPDNIRKFQKDTSSLRDELAVKQVELEQEMNKADYDPLRAASIKKEIIDIEAKIETLAKKSNVYSGCGCNNPAHDGTTNRGYGTMRGGCNWSRW